MVKLTTALIEKKCSETQSNKSLTKEIDKDRSNSKNKFKGKFPKNFKRH